MSKGRLNELAEEKAKVVVVFQYDMFDGQLEIRNEDEIWFVSSPRKDLALSFLIDETKIWRIEVDQDGMLTFLRHTVEFDCFILGRLPFH